MTGALLEIKNLSIAYDNYGWAVDRVSLTVEQGHTLGLIGESGSGKTSIVNAIVGMLGPTRSVGGLITFRGRNLLTMPPATLGALRGREIGVVPQAALGSLNPVRTIGSQMREIVRNFQRGSRRTAQNVAADLLAAVALPNPRDLLARYPHELSGGQQQRVLIAMALAGEPKLVLADEPTTALDVTVQQRIIALLAKLQAEFGFGMMFVTHQLSLLPGLSDSVVVMRRGRAIERGTVREIVAAPATEYARGLIASAHMIQADTAEQNDASGSAETLLEVSNLSVSYPSRGLFGGKPTTALRDVSFRVAAGQCLGVVGESGSGKSTLCQSLLGLLPSRGKILLRGQAVDSSTPAGCCTLRSFLHLVFQDSLGALNPGMQVSAILKEPAAAFGRVLSNIEIGRMLQEVGLPGSFASRRPATLSGGERQRVAIARGIASGARILVLDEPLSALDVSTQWGILTLLRRLLNSREIAFLLVSHDLGVIGALANDVIVLKSGEVREQGRTKDVLSYPADAYTRALLDAVPKLESPAAGMISPSVPSAADTVRSW